MKLYHKVLGEGRPMLILHGLFGSSDNWLSHAREFSQHFKVYLVDQRNHGHSPHSDEFDYDLMSEDLAELLAGEDLRDVTLIGHSMGGKTIMRFAQQYGFLIDKMVVADMGVKQYQPHHDKIFEGLFAADVSNRQSRKEVEQILSNYVDEKDTLQFLMKNLYWKEPGKLAWRFNLEALHNHRVVAVSALPADKITCPVLFIRGELSKYIQDEDFDQIKEIIPHAELRTIAGAGHWVHAEAPEAFRKEVLQYLL